MYITWSPVHVFIRTYLVARAASGVRAEYTHTRAHTHTHTRIVTLLVLFERRVPGELPGEHHPLLRRQQQGRRNAPSLLHLM